MPNFEVLHARIASEPNRIIHNSHFKRRISLEKQKAQKEDRFFRGRQIAYLIYECFRVIGANDSVENYADMFTGIRFEMRLLSMTKIPSDDILEGLYQLRTRESEKLKTVLELYNMETLLSQIEDNGEKKYRAESPPETEIMRQAPWSRIRERNSVNKEV